MSKEIRRLHRRKTDFTNFSSSQSPDLPNPTESDIQQDSDDAFSLPLQIADSFSTTTTNDINTIRAELLEDQYHDDLAESDYSDDTHDWGWDSQSLSDHYWHFLGQYE